MNLIGAGQTPSENFVGCFIGKVPFEWQAIIKFHRKFRMFREHEPPSLFHRVFRGTFVQVPSSSYIAPLHNHCFFCFSTISTRWCFGATLWGSEWFRWWWLYLASRPNLPSSFFFTSLSFQTIRGRTDFETVSVLDPTKAREKKVGGCTRKLWPARGSWARQVCRIRPHVCRTLCLIHVDLWLYLDKCARAIICGCRSIWIHASSHIRVLFSWSSFSPILPRNWGWLQQWLWPRIHIFADLSVVW